MGVMDLRRSILLNEPHIATVTGNPVSVKTDIKGKLKSCKANWTPVQSGTGDPSPSNVRPITGWTGVDAVRCGKNMLSSYTEILSGNQNTSRNIKCTKYDNYITLIGTADSAGAAYFMNSNSDNGTFELKAGGSYYLSFAKNSEDVYLVGKIYYEDGTETSISYLSSMNFTPSKNGRLSLYILLRNVVAETEYNITLSDFQIEVGESASSYAPYSGNSYPVTFPAMGKNLIRDTVRKVQNAYTVFVGSKNAYDTFLKAGTYTFSVETYNDVKVDGHVMQEDGTRYYPFTKGSNPYTGSGSFTLTEDAWVKFDVYSSSGIDPDNIGHCQVEAGQTATTYEPYTNTVYGGSLDVVTGELTVEWAYADLGKFLFNINNEETYPFFYVGAVMTGGKSFANSVLSTIKCKQYKTVISSTIANSTSGDCVIATLNPLGIRIRDDRYETAEALKTALDGVCVYYELAEPLTYQLTPQQINTLIGDNTIWSDTNGNLEIKLWKH